MLAKGFVTVVISTIALIGICLLFAPSSLSHGALEGSLPFAAIIAIVGLGQLLVVQQGGFDLSLAGGVSLAVVISTHYPQGDNALLLPAVLMAIACAIMAGLANGIFVSLFSLNAIVATIGVNALLYGAVFAVSGGVPKTTTTLLAAIAGGRALGLPNSLYFALAALLVVSFILKKSVAGRRFYFPARPEWLHKLPDAVDDAKGALIEPFTCGFYAVLRNGAPNASETVVVSGGGPIGLVAAAAAIGMGARVIVVDPVQLRRDIAKRLGADAAVDPSAGRSRRGGAGVDPRRGRPCRRGVGPFRLARERL